MGFIAVLLAIPLALTLLFIYCFSQKPRTRLLKPGLAGLVVGAVAGVGAMLPILPGLRYLDAGTGLIFLLNFAGAGATIGAYAGVAGVECLSPDLDRRSAARRGALYGLAGGATVAVLLALAGGGWFRSHYVVFILVPLAAMGAAIGALVGAQLSDRASGETVHYALLVRRLRIVGLVVGVGVVLAGAYWIRETHVNKVKREAFRQQSQGWREENTAPLEQLKSEDPAERAAGARALAAGSLQFSPPDQRVLPALTSATQDSSREVRMAAIAALGTHRSEEASAALGELLESRDPDTRVAALQALASSRFYASRHYLFEAANSADPQFAAMARELIRQSSQRQRR